MITLNRNWFQNCHYRCLSENFISILLATQTMVESKKQDMKKIVSSSVILHYVHYCHPNLKNVVKIQGHVWLGMLNIWKNYTFIITVKVRSLFKKLKDLSQNAQNIWLRKSKFAYVKLIKIHSCHMGVIITPNQMTWQRQQCVHIHSQIMCYHTEMYIAMLCQMSKH